MVGQADTDAAAQPVEENGDAKGGPGEEEGGKQRQGMDGNEEANSRPAELVAFGAGFLGMTAAVGMEISCRHGVANTVECCKYCLHL